MSKLSRLYILRPPFKLTPSAERWAFNPELFRACTKRGSLWRMPIDSVQALKGGEAAIAYGTFTSKYTDPNTPPGQGNWLQVFERDGQGWKIVAHASSRAALALNK
jgi:hypothetical protein